MTITIYTSPTCHWCHKAKAFLKTKAITFTEIDVSQDAVAAAEVVEKSGQKGVPVIDIDGTIIVGFDQAALSQALKKNVKKTA